MKPTYKRPLLLKSSYLKYTGENVEIICEFQCGMLYWGCHQSNTTSCRLIGFTISLNCVKQQSLKRYITYLCRLLRSLVSQHIL